MYDFTGRIGDDGTLSARSGSVVVSAALGRTLSGTTVTLVGPLTLSGGVGVLKGQATLTQVAATG